MSAEVSLCGGKSMHCPHCAGGLLDCRLADRSVVRALLGSAGSASEILLDTEVREGILSAAKAVLSLPWRSAAAPSPSPATAAILPAKRKRADPAGVQDPLPAASDGPSAAGASVASQVAAAALRTRLLKVLWELSADSAFAEQLCLSGVMSFVLEAAARLSAAPADMSVEQLAEYSLACYPSAYPGYPIAQGQAGCEGEGATNSVQLPTTWFEEIRRPISATGMDSGALDPAEYQKVPFSQRWSQREIAWTECGLCYEREGEAHTDSADLGCPLDAAGGATPWSHPHDLQSAAPVEPERVSEDRSSWQRRPLARR